MFKLLFAATAATLATSAGAQNLEPPVYGVTAGQGPGQAELPSRPITPTMQRQQLQRALALREEAERLRLQDGGTLSEASLRRIRAEAYEILHGAQLGPPRAGSRRYLYR